MEEETIDGRDDEQVDDDSPEPMKVDDDDEDSTGKLKKKSTNAIALEAAAAIKAVESVAVPLAPSTALHGIDDEALPLTTSDKGVSTNEDLQRALTYEAVFSTLIENKVLAMKRDCEERKHAKRMKRKSIGRIFFPKKLFGGGGGVTRKSASLRDVSELEEQHMLTESPLSPRVSPIFLKTAKVSEQASRLKASDAIEVASASSESHRSQKSRSKSKTAIAPEEPVPAPVPLNADDSLASTLSNSSDKNSVGPVIKRNLLVRVQTHTPAAEVVLSSSSSGESKDVPLTRLSAANGNDNGLPASVYETASLASGYDNGTCAHGLHTSTMADESLTSMRDSIESLSLASSRCTVSFGGTEIIPEDTASLLYERARVAKRLRILEAKSISAQCSPIFPRHTIPMTKVTTAAMQSTIPVPSITTVPATVAPTAPPLPIISTQTKTRFLPKQVSYTDSIGCVGGPSGVADLDAAYTRYFSRQNTSEDSANLTVSTLLNQSDSLSLHAPVYSSSSSAAGRGTGIDTTKHFSIGDRHKSKSTSLLVTSSNGRSRPPPSLATPSSIALPQPQPHCTLPTKQLEQLRITSNISHSERFVDSIPNKHILGSNGIPGLPITCTAASSPPPLYYPVITTTSAVVAFAATAADTMSLSTTIRNVANGAIVASSTMPGDTAKLNRMTSTSTGSSVAPTGCCATTKSTSRDRDKPRFKPSWPSGQSGSDDEYRRRKRKYKRYHRCSDPVLVYPTPSGLQHCILSVPPNDPVQFPYTEDIAYDMQLQIESDKNDDLEEIVPSSNRRHRRHRHHRHKKRHRHKKPKILVHDLEAQVVKVIDPDDLPQRARWTIIATAFLLLLMCLMLVGITLRMAPIIDDMEMQFKFRQENERLMKETMDRARFGKNYTESASLISTAGHLATHTQQIP